MGFVHHRRVAYRCVTVAGSLTRGPTRNGSSPTSTGRTSVPAHRQPSPTPARQPSSPSQFHGGVPQPTPPSPTATHPVMARRGLRYCPHCRTLHRGPCLQRDYQDERQRLHILADYRGQRGDVCPGTPWCTTPNQPHPVASGDLTVDHTRGRAQGGTLNQGWAVMCRTANTRKK